MRPLRRGAQQWGRSEGGCGRQHRGREGVAVVGWGAAAAGPSVAVFWWSWHMRLLARVCMVHVGSNAGVRIPPWRLATSLLLGCFLLQQLSWLLMFTIDLLVLLKRGTTNWLHWAPAPTAQPGTVTAYDGAACTCACVSAEHEHARTHAHTRTHHTHARHACTRAHATSQLPRAAARAVRWWACSSCTHHQDAPPLPGPGPGSPHAARRRQPGHGPVRTAACWCAGACCGGVGALGRAAGALHGKVHRALPARHDARAHAQAWTKRSRCSWRQRSSRWGRWGGSGTQRGAAHARARTATTLPARMPCPRRPQARSMGRWGHGPAMRHGGSRRAA